MSTELAEGAVNILHTDKVIYYSYVSDIEAIEACIRFLNVMIMMSGRLSWLTSAFERALK